MITKRYFVVAGLATAPGAGGAVAQTQEVTFGHADMVIRSAW